MQRGCLFVSLLSCRRADAQMWRNIATSKDVLLGLRPHVTRDAFCFHRKLCLVGGLLQLAQKYVRFRPAASQSLAVAALRSGLQLAASGNPGSFETACPMTRSLQVGLASRFSFDICQGRKNSFLERQPQGTGNCFIVSRPLIASPSRHCCGIEALVLHERQQASPGIDCEAAELRPRTNLGPQAVELNEAILFFLFGLGLVAMPFNQGTRGTRGELTCLP